MPDRRDASEKLVSHETRIGQIEDFVDGIKDFAKTLLISFAGICVVACSGLAWVLNIYLQPVNLQLQHLNTTLRTLTSEIKDMRKVDGKHDGRIGKLEVRVDNLEKRVDR